MKAIMRIFQRVWLPQWPIFLLGTLLTVLVSAAGVTLLGLSGWFIAAAGMAGVAGVGAIFDVFGPSAAIRFLALGRAAGRYGERLVTHEATLRGLARLRGQILGAMTRLPIQTLSLLRGSERLNHLTIDVDALDGVALRLMIPFLSAILAFAAAFGGLWLLCGLLEATVLIGSFIVGTVLAIALSLRFSAKPSRMAHRAMQALRMRFIDMMRAQTELTIHGRLESQRQAVLSAHDRLQDAQARNDRTERLSGFVLGTAASVAAAAALLLGSLLVEAGVMNPSIAALGFFTALALTDIAAPLHRGIIELGKMQDAARRIDRQLSLSETEANPAPHPVLTATTAPAPILSMEHVSFQRNGRDILDNFSLRLRAGDTTGLVGPSGVGKSTILLLACGQLQPLSGTIMHDGRMVAGLSDQQLFSGVSFLPQRSALMSGTIMDALRLADPDLQDAGAWAVLQAVSLSETIEAKGGLSFWLGEAGSGLSGGEQRRLSLARVLLRKPRLLLLDEPTEGLDDTTARRVLDGIRTCLPDAAILLASHRPAEQLWADTIIDLDEKLPVSAAKWHAMN